MLNITKLIQKFNLKDTLKDEYTVYELIYHETLEKRQNGDPSDVLKIYDLGENIYILQNYSYNNETNYFIFSTLDEAKKEAEKIKSQGYKTIGDLEHEIEQNSVYKMLKLSYKIDTKFNEVTLKKGEYYNTYKLNSSIDELLKWFIDDYLEYLENLEEWEK